MSTSSNNNNSNYNDFTTLSEPPSVNVSPIILAGTGARFEETIRAIKEQVNKGELFTTLDTDYVEQGTKAILRVSSGSPTSSEQITKAIDFAYAPKLTLTNNAEDEEHRQAGKDETPATAEKASKNELGSTYNPSGPNNTPAGLITPDGPSSRIKPDFSGVSAALEIALNVIAQEQNEKPPAFGTPNEGTEPSPDTILRLHSLFESPLSELYPAYGSSSPVNKIVNEFRQRWSTLLFNEYIVRQHENALLAAYNKVLECDLPRDHE